MAKTNNNKNKAPFLQQLLPLLTKLSRRTCFVKLYLQPSLGP